MSVWFTVLVQVAVLIAACGLSMLFVKDFWDRVWVLSFTAGCWGLVMALGWSGGFAWLYGVQS